MTVYGISGKVLKFGRGRAKFSPSVDLVFSDKTAIDAMPPSYWSNWVCPHIFYCQPSLEVTPLPNWIVQTERVKHAQVGGSTDAVWDLVLLLPPGAHVQPVIPVPRQPWIPIFARIDKQLRSIPCPGLVSSGVHRPDVLPHPTEHGIVLASLLDMCL